MGAMRASDSSSAVCVFRNYNDTIENRSVRSLGRFAGGRGRRIKKGLQNASLAWKRYHDRAFILNNNRKCGLANLKNCAACEDDKKTTFPYIREAIRVSSKADD